MRVLFTSITELGHIHPMIPVARAAMDRGWEVVWATGADACPRIERAGIKAVLVAEGTDPSALRQEVERKLRWLGLRDPVVMVELVQAIERLPSGSCSGLCRSSRPFPRAG